MPIRNGMKSYVLLASLSIAALACPVRGDFTLVPANAIGGAAIGDSIGRGVGNALASFGELRSASASVNRRFDEAERGFFAAPAGSDARAAAGQELFTLLLLRDMHYATEAFMREVSQQLTPGQDLIGLINRFAIAGGAVGGGTPPYARGHYDEWTSAMNQEIGDGLLRMFQGGFQADRISRAFERTLPIYDRYRLVRDYGLFAEHGRLGDFFPDAEAWLRFHLLLDARSSPQRIVLRRLTADDLSRQLGEAVNAFGEEALRAAIGQVAEQPTSGPLQFAQPVKFDGPFAATTRPDVAVMQALAGHAGWRGRGAVLLTDHGSVAQFNYGAMRLEAMLAEHGEGRVHSVLRDLFDAEVDPSGKLVGGRWEGLTVFAALTRELPLAADPVVAAREAAARLAQEKIAAAEAARRAEALKRGQELARIHYDRFINARDLARHLDEDYVARMTAGGQAQFIDPYYLWLPRVDAMAGLWNEFAETGDQRAGQMASGMLPRGRQKPEMAQMIVNNLSFLAQVNQFDPDTLAPLSWVAQERQAAGRLRNEETLDLRQTMDRYRLTSEIGRVLSNIRFIERQPRMAQQTPQFERDLAVNRAILRSLEASLEAMDAVQHGETSAAPVGAWAVEAARAGAEVAQ